MCGVGRASQSMRNCSTGAGGDERTDLEPALKHAGLVGDDEQPFVLWLGSGG